MDIIFSLEVLWWLFVGVFVGVTVGALPGLAISTGMALMLPLTYYMNTGPALALLIGVYKGATFGGSISAITFSTPGIPAAAATVYDGYKMMKQGKGRKALQMALYASITGDTLSDIVTIVLSTTLAIIALQFGPTERFLIMFMAFILIGTLSGKNIFKGLISGSMGVLLALVGSDPVSLVPRLTFNIWWLRDGIPIIPMIIGLFAVSKMVEELYKIIMRKRDDIVRNKEDESIIKTLFSKTSEKLTFQEYLSCWREMLMGTVVGSIAGMLPGVGSSGGAFLSYGVAKQFSKNKENIGEGALEGIAAAESGNNATMGPTLIPLLVFGIPGSIGAALIGSALTFQGATPSPRMFELHPTIIYALFVLLIVANLVNLLVGNVMIRFYSRMGQLPKYILAPFIIMLAIIGTYVVSNNRYDVIIMLVIALLGFLLNLAKFPTAPLVIAFILTPLIERTFRIALQTSYFDYRIMFESTLSKALVAITILLLIGVVKLKNQRRKLSGDFDD